MATLYFFDKSQFDFNFNNIKKQVGDKQLPQPATILYITGKK